MKLTGFVWGGRRPKMQFSIATRGYYSPSLGVSLHPSSLRAWLCG